MKYRAKLELYDENDERVEWAQSAEVDATDSRGWRREAVGLALTLIGWLRVRRDG